MYRLERITWMDHCSMDNNTGWNPLSKVAEMTPEVINTVGWIIHESDTHLIIVGSFGEDNEQVASDILIIKSCITGREVLKDDNPT